MEETKTYSERLKLEISREEDSSRKKLLEHILRICLQGKEDALKGYKSAELRQAYINGYNEGIEIRNKTIEQRWYD